MDQKFGLPYVVDPVTGCWLWVTRSPKKRYGWYKDASAHRASWEFHFGAIPEGMHVCHKCDVKLCVNPSHLYLASNAQNLRDAFERGLVKGKKRLPPAEMDQVYDLRFSDMTQKQIGSAYGISQISVSRIWRDKGYTRGKGTWQLRDYSTRRGEQAPTAKLTNIERDQIWDMRLSGWTSRDIGEAYGVSGGAISYVWVRGGYRQHKTWKRRSRNE